MNVEFVLKDNGSNVTPEDVSALFKQSKRKLEIYGGLNYSTLMSKIGLTKIDKDIDVCNTYFFDYTCREYMQDAVRCVTNVRKTLLEVSNYLKNDNYYVPCGARIVLNIETKSYINALSDENLESLSRGMSRIICRKTEAGRMARVERYSASQICVVLTLSNAHTCTIASSYVQILRDGEKELIDFLISKGKVMPRFSGFSQSVYDELARLLLKPANHMTRGGTDKYKAATNIITAMGIWYGVKDCYSPNTNGPVNGAVASISAYRASAFFNKFEEEINHIYSRFELGDLDGYSVGNFVDAMICYWNVADFEDED